MWMSETNKTPNYAATHLRTPKIYTNTADDSARSGFGFISADIVHVNVYYDFHSTADNVVTFPNEEKLFINEDRTIKVDLGSTVYINDAKVEGCGCDIHSVPTPTYTFKIDAPPVLKGLMKEKAVK
jgi:hypothetical protein